MDMSKHPKSDQAEAAVAARHDWSNPGAVWAALIAVAWIAALAVGFVVGGLAGLATVKVVLVPVIMLVLALITVGR